MHLFERVVYLALASLFFYLSIADKNDQKRIVNLLDPLWKECLKKAKAPLSGLTVYLRAVARLTTYLFDRTFGKKLFSFRTVCISVSFALASTELATTRVVPQLVQVVSLSAVYFQSQFTKLVWIFLLTLLGLSPFTIKDRKLIRLWYVAVIMATVIWGAKYLTKGLPSDLYVNAFGNFTVVLVASFACDVIFIVLLRRGLRYAETLERKSGIAAIALGTILASVLLVSIPFVPWLILNGYDAKMLYPIGFYNRSFDFLLRLSATPGLARFYVLNALPFFGATSIFDLLAASVYFCLAVLMLVHPLLWGVARRLITNLEDALPGIIRRRMTWLVGCIFFGSCTLTGTFNLAQLVKLLHSVI